VFLSAFAIVCYHCNFTVHCKQISQKNTAIGGFWNELSTKKRIYLCSMCHRQATNVTCISRLLTHTHTHTHTPIRAQLTESDSANRSTHQQQQQCIQYWCSDSAVSVKTRSKYSSILRHQVSTRDILTAHTRKNLPTLFRLASTINLWHISSLFFLLLPNFFAHGQSFM